jgi:hypothetical protein
VRRTGEKHTERPPPPVGGVVLTKITPEDEHGAKGTLCAGLSDQSGSLATIFGYDALSVPITFDLFGNRASVCRPVTNSPVFSMAITHRDNGSGICSVPAWEYNGC